MRYFLGLFAVMPLIIGPASASTKISREGKQVMAPIASFYRTNAPSGNFKKLRLQAYKQSVVKSRRCANKVWAESATQTEAARVGAGAKAAFYRSWRVAESREQALSWFYKNRESIGIVVNSLHNLSLNDDGLRRAAAAQANANGLLLSLISFPPPKGLACSSLRLLRTQPSWDKDTAELSTYLTLGLGRGAIDVLAYDGQLYQRDIKLAVEELRQAGASRRDLSVYRGFPIGAWFGLGATVRPKPSLSPPQIPGGMTPEGGVDTSDYSIEATEALMGAFPTDRSNAQGLEGLTLRLVLPVELEPQAELKLKS